jgi:hypothetical protein
VNADAFPWVDEGNEKRCTRHDRKFARTSVCSECAKGMREPLPRVAKEPLPKPPKGCMSTVEIERWFTDLARDSAARAVAIAAYSKPRRASKDDAKVAGGTVIFDATAKGKRKAKGKTKGKAAKAELVVPDFDFHLEASIANHRDRAIKAMRAACDLATRREDDAIVDARDERMAGRERGAAH